MATPSEVHLTYSPRPYWHRRRAFRRVILAICVAFLVTAAIKGGPPLWLRAKVVYYQDQCLRFQLPADQVAYDPKTPLELKSPQLSESSVARPFSLDTPACLQKLTALFPGLGCTLPPFVQPPPGVITTSQFQAFFSANPQLFGPQPVSSLGFMHELQNPKGDRRLVVVQPPLNLYWISYDIYEIAPAWKIWSPLQPPKSHFASCYVTQLLNPPAGPAPRIFAGQADPNDLSHFTFTYDCPTGKGIIDGYLTDQCTIEMKVRDGPAKTPPAPQNDAIQFPPSANPYHGGYEDLFRKMDLIDPRSPAFAN